MILVTPRHWPRLSHVTRTKSWRWPHRPRPPPRPPNARPKSFPHRPPMGTTPAAARRRCDCSIGNFLAIGASLNTASNPNAHKSCTALGTAMPFFLFGYMRPGHGRRWVCRLRCPGGLSKNPLNFGRVLPWRWPWGCRKRARMARYLNTPDRKASASAAPGPLPATITAARCAWAL